MIKSWDSQNHFQSLVGRHNEQHQQSVNAAREELRKKLGSLTEGKGAYQSQVGAGQFGNSYSSSGSERYNAAGSTGSGVLCTLCSNTDSFSERNSRYKNILFTDLTFFVILY